MRQPLIFLHGALGNIDQFNELTSLLGDDYDIHTFNFSGHGGRVCSEPYSIHTFAHDVAVYVDSNDIPKADLFGYSMGGYVALKYASEFPDRVNRIMTLGTKFDWTPATAAREVKMLNPEIIMEKVPRFAEILMRRHGPESWRGVLQRTAEMMLRMGDGEILNFNTISIPHEALICVGTEDNVVTIEESKNIAETLPNSRLQVITGIKHPIEQVPVDVLARLVKSFFT